MNQCLGVDELRTVSGELYDAIFTHFRSLPGVDTILKSLHDAEGKSELDTALRGARVFIEYNSCPQARQIMGRFHHLLPE